MKAECPTCQRMTTIRSNGTLAAHGPAFSCEGSGVIANEELHKSTLSVPKQRGPEGITKPSWGQASCCEEHSIFQLPRRCLLSDEFDGWRV